MSTSSKEYSIRITRHSMYPGPVLVTIYDVWCGEEWKSGHETREEAERKVKLLREHGEDYRWRLSK